MGKLVNKRELAEIFGVSQVTITTKQKKGLPIKQKAEKSGQANLYDTAEVIKWWVADAGGNNYHAEKARLTKEQADKAELEVAKMRGELVELDLVSREWSRMLASIRQTFLTLPSKIVPLIQASDQEYLSLKNIVEDGVREVLTEASELDNAEDGDTQAAT